MKIEKVYLSIHARDFAAQSEWWSTVLGRRWDREPMPSCHEWDLAGCVHFQVLDSAEGGTTAVALHVDDLDAELRRLSEAGVEVGAPVKVEGFETLRFAQFSDPEGNPVGLLDGK